MRHVTDSRRIAQGMQAGQAAVAHTSARRVPTGSAETTEGGVRRNTRHYIGDAWKPRVLVCD
jgi:hypothetical protein